MWGNLWGSAPTAADSYTEADALWYLNPSPEQQTSLEKFRAAVTDERLAVEGHDDDFTLLRFLMARDFNVAKALSMYRDMRAWRIENGVNGLYDSDPTGAAYPDKQRLLQVYPHFYFNTDKFGRPVYIELLGRTDANALFATISVEELIRYHIWTWERYLRCYLPACSAAAGRHICTATVIIDLAGLSLLNFNSATQKLLSTFSKIDQDYYPEHLGTMFVINTPLIFRGIWAAVQPLLQDRTRKKIIILGADYIGELSKIVPLERLPEVFGGRMPLDPTYCSVGPWQDAQQQQQPAAATAAETGQQQPQRQETSVEQEQRQETSVEQQQQEQQQQEQQGCDTGAQEEGDVEDAGADAHVSITGREEEQQQPLGKGSSGMGAANPGRDRLAGSTTGTLAPSLTVST